MTPRTRTFSNAVPRKAAALLLMAASVACADRTPPTAVEPQASASLAPQAGSVRYSFTKLEIPGALAAVANGINAGGDIVGTYRNAGGIHGFILRGGDVTSFDFPGATVTEGRGIGPGGEVVGSYRLPGETGFRIHGFHRTSDGEFVQADFPGHPYAIPQRILPDGTILGCRHHQDLMASMRGAQMGRDGYAETDAFASMHNGATPDGRLIVGLYTNMMERRGEGYVIEDGVFTPLLVPGSRSTAAWDVNPAGEIVGVFSDASGIHGFVRLQNGEFVTLDVPGATVTRAFGINARGDVVGTYLVGPAQFAFVARRHR